MLSLTVLRRRRRCSGKAPLSQIRLLILVSPPIQRKQLWFCFVESRGTTETWARCWEPELEVQVSAAVDPLVSSCVWLVVNVSACCGRRRQKPWVYVCLSTWFVQKHGSVAVFLTQCPAALLSSSSSPIVSDGVQCNNVNEVSTRKTSLWDHVLHFTPVKRLKNTSWINCTANMRFKCLLWIGNVQEQQNFRIKMCCCVIIQMLTLQYVSEQSGSYTAPGSSPAFYCEIFADTWCLIFSPVFPRPVLASRLYCSYRPCLRTLLQTWLFLPC